MERTTWSEADPALRSELEALLAAPNDAFESDFQDALVWWLLLMIAGFGGAGASIWQLLTSEGDYGLMLSFILENPVNGLYGLLLSPSYLGLPVGLIVGLWGAVSCARNVGRRGIALTSDAIVLLRGPKLLVYRFAEIATAEHRVIRTKKQTFSVITVKLKDGRKKDLYCHGRFAQLAMQKLGGSSQASPAAA